MADFKSKLLRKFQNAVTSGLRLVTGHPAFFQNFNQYDMGVLQKRFGIPNLGDLIQAKTNAAITKTNDYALNFIYEPSHELTWDNVMDSLNPYPGFRLEIVAGNKILLSSVMRETEENLYMFSGQYTGAAADYLYDHSEGPMNQEYVFAVYRALMNAQPNDELRIARIIEEVKPYPESGGALQLV